MTQKNEIAPLARLVFGWTFAPQARLWFIGALGALGALLVVGEYARPRAGLHLPFEEQPGFYAALGVGAVVAVVLAAFALRWLAWNNPYPDETAGEAPDEGPEADSHGDRNADRTGGPDTPLPGAPQGGKRRARDKGADGASGAREGGAGR